MILEIILAFFSGIIAGTLTGLTPGIHINLVATLLLSSLFYLSSVPPIALVVFIVSMSITHTLIDFIPSVFLGAPEEDTALSILPGHQLLKEGKGHEAVALTSIGAISAIPIILVFTPIFIYLLPSFYLFIKIAIPFILIFISIYMILREEDLFSAFTIFALSGFLGLAVFNLPVKEPLMPLLTGLFGLSSLLVSIQSKAIINKQTIPKLKEVLPLKKEVLSSFRAAALVAPICSFLPGIGSGHAAVIGSEMTKQTNRKFLLLIGIINLTVMSLSFMTLFAINKTRTGSAAAVQEILKSLTYQHLVTIVLAIIFSAFLSFFVTLKISRLFASNINKIKYSKLNILIVILLLLVNILFTNWLGLLTLLISASLGLYCILSNSKRINMMGVLIVPSITYYLLS